MKTNSKSWREGRTVHSILKKIKIKGREIELVPVDRLVKKITKQGDGGKVLIPKKYLNDQYTAEVTVYGPPPFICFRCGELFRNIENFSPNPKRCLKCFNAEKTIEDKKDKLKCEKCSKKITELDYRNAWDREICSECWEKEIESKSNKINKEDDLNF